MANFDGDDILKKVHRIVELNTDYPTSGEDDYDLRFGLLNDHIDAWDTEEGILWSQLWTLASFSCSGATSYTLSGVSPVITNMRFPGGFIEHVSSTGASVYWDVIKPEEVRLHTNDSYSYAYFLGDPQTGFTLYFNPNLFPASGGTIKFPYYKKATRLTTGADKPEMSDPEFLVHSIASDVLAQDDPGESDKHLQIAQSRLRGMKTLNAMNTHWQKNRVEDLAGVTMSSGFGN